MNERRFKYCTGRGQQIALEVCEKYQSDQKCVIKKNGSCAFATMKRRISEKERQRRSELMKRLNDERLQKQVETEKEVQPKYDIESTDVG